MEPAIDIRVHRIGRLRYRRHRALGQSLPAHCAAYSILYCKYKWQPIRTFTRTRLRSEAWRCTRSSFPKKHSLHRGWDQADIPKLEHGAVGLPEPGRDVGRHMPLHQDHDKPCRSEGR